MRTGSPAFGTPEYAQAVLIGCQLARRYDIPYRTSNVTASNTVDAQAAYESADSMHSTALGGGNYILHAAGWLEAGLVTSYEKLILDADRLGAYQVMLSGISTDDNGLATDAYKEVAPGRFGRKRGDRPFRKSRVVTGVVYGLVNLRTDGSKIMCATMREQRGGWTIRTFDARF